MKGHGISRERAIIKVTNDDFPRTVRGCGCADETVDHPSDGAAWHGQRRFWRSINRMVNGRIWPVIDGMALSCSQLYGKNVLPIIIPKDRSMEIYVEAVT